MTDEQLVAECVRRGWRVCYPGDPKDAGLFDPPDPDVKTAAEQRVLDSAPALNAAIRRAAELFESVQTAWPRVYGAHVVAITDWLTLPVVEAALTPRGERDTPVEPMPAVPQCRNASKSDGGHSLDYRQGGRCAWCGAKAT